jgi:predicted deacylase
MFPGSLNGSLASQFAHQFTKEIAPFVDYVIDYHTGGGERDNIAQIRLDTSEEKTLELANVFNPPFVVHSNYIAKSLRESLKKMGKIALLFEGGKSKNLDPVVIDHGIRGTKNVLTHLGFIDGDISITLKPTFIKKAKWLRSNHSGMFKILVENGTHVKKKDILGVIQDPFGEFKKNIYAPFDCHIFCINKTPIVNKGEALFHVSIDE